MAVADELLASNALYAASFPGHLPLPPRRRLAIVACMDSRLNLFEALGLAEGDAHLIRNAGGVVTDEEIRSLAMSQRLMGTREIVLIHHTDCGMLKLADGEFRRQLEEETGVRPTWIAEAFDDVDEDVRRCIARIKASPFLPYRDSVRGFVFDIGTGRLHEVDG